MRTVVVGDHFIPAEYYVNALRQVCGPDFGPVSTVDWAGDKKTHGLVGFGHVGRQLAGERIASR